MNINDLEWRGAINQMTDEEGYVLLTEAAHEKRTKTRCA